MIGTMKTAVCSCPRIALRLSLPLIAFLNLLSCTPVTPLYSSGTIRAQTLAPAKLPEYTAGITYVYSDGTWERVAEAHPSYVVWENHRGERSLASTDFTYRSAKWERNGLKGYRTFAPTEFLYTQSNASIWPLTTGNRTHYDEKSKWGVPGIYQNHSNATWKCSVEGTEQINVPAGSFDTWKISCSRYSKNQLTSRLTLWENKTFHYAPAIGHWVVLDQTFKNSKARIRKELVAVLPSLSGLGVDSKSSIGIKEHFQQTLGNLPNGQMDRWTDSAGKISFSMTPIATYRLADGTPCRQYEQRLDLISHSKSYYGIACRGETGLWAVPRR